MIITKYISKVGRSYKVSEHFTLGEFQSKDGADIVKYDTVILAMLEKLRAYYGGKIKITSGYRSAADNARVNGDSRSAHLYGQAVDFVVYNKMDTIVPSKTICLHLEAVGWKGSIGKMINACHIDTKYTNKMDETKKPYFFLNRQTPAMTFATYFGFKKMTVNVPVANIRNKPSIRGLILGTKVKGQKVYVFKTTKDEKGQEWVRTNFIYPRWIAKRLLV